jgi:hypothetical protein
MTRISLGALGAAALLAGAAIAPIAASQAVWTPYRNAQFHLVIDTPSPPQIKIATSRRIGGPAPTLTGGIDLHERGALFFTVIDLTDSKAEQDADAVLQDSVAAIRRRYTVDRVTPMQVNGAPGLEIFSHDSDGTAYRVRAFVAGHRLYTALAGGPPNALPAEFERFEGSMRAE